MSVETQSQAWQRVYQEHSSKIQSRIDKAQDTLATHNEAVVDRIVRVATQITILFLTGWVALLAASKLGPIESHRELIGFCCFLHVVGLILLIANQWSILINYDGRSMDLLATSELLNSGTTKIQSWIVSNSAASEQLNFQDKLTAVEAECLKSFYGHEQASVAKFLKLQKRSWLLAKLALGTFFSSALTSLTVMIILAH